MASRFGIALAICFCWASVAASQVVRLQTSIGDFDMVLNPTNNAQLQGHVDNMVRYVEDNRYNSSWINRADTGFVLQMGGFYSHTKRLPITIDSTRPVATFDPVQGAPGIPGLSNTIGTVSLALPGDGMGGTNEDAGTSSFFVNLTSNSFLDADFTVFAAIPDMTVVNQIMALMTVDRTTDPVFGAGPGNLAFTDVPIQANGQQVFINRAFVITDPLAIARATAGVQSTMVQSAASFSESENAIGGGSGSPLTTASAVPEPATISLMLLALLGAAGLLMRRRRLI